MGAYAKNDEAETFFYMEERLHGKLIFGFSLRKGAIQTISRKCGKMK